MTRRHVRTVRMELSARPYGGGQTYVPRTLLPGREPVRMTGSCAGSCRPVSRGVAPPSSCRASGAPSALRSPHSRHSPQTPQDSRTVRFPQASGVADRNAAGLWNAGMVTDLLTTAQAAAALRAEGMPISAETLRRYAHSGLVTPAHVTPGGWMYFDLAEV